MDNFYTYCHCKPDGSVFYVGKGIGNRAWAKDNRNVFWKRTVAKYGYSVKLMAIWDTEENAFDHEKRLIRFFKESGTKLVNLTNGGEGSAGYKWTEEQRAKFDISGEKNGMFGKRHSDETRNKIRQKATGRKLSENVKQKIAEKLKNRQFTEEHLAKLKGKGIGNKYGIGNKGPSKKCEINGIVYASTKIASKAIGISANAIQKRCVNPNYPSFKYI